MTSLKVNSLLRSLEEHFKNLKFATDVSQSEANAVTAVAQLRICINQAFTLNGTTWTWGAYTPNAMTPSAAQIADAQLKVNNALTFLQELPPYICVETANTLPAIPGAYTAAVAAAIVALAAYTYP